ncbi:MAG: hypothetical protein HY825_09870 [Acidobacteria bacterium]|nr:hypothetical protein [Acidobacteriota bacterium]
MPESASRRPAGRRRADKPWALLAGVVRAAAIAVLRTRPAPPPLPASEPQPSLSTAAPTAAPNAPPVPAGVTPVVGSSSVTLAWRPDPTEPPAWVPPTDTPEPEIEPTPSFDECLPFRIEAYDSPGRLGQVIVEIWATNRCGRDLGPLDVWFRVSGLRDGIPERWVDAHPFDAPLRGREVHVTVALPGAVDYYERIEVRPFAPGR